MFERALVIEYLSQSRDKTISGIRMKNSIFESHVGKMLVTWVTLMLVPSAPTKIHKIPQNTAIHRKIPQNTAKYRKMILEGFE